MLRSTDTHRTSLDDSDGSTGGPPYSYPCDTSAAAKAWMNLPSVQTAFHVASESFLNRTWSGCGGGLHYNTYTHSSLDVYPDLLKKYRILVFNGDADACVPYNGNEDWTNGLAKELGLTAVEEFRPWVVDSVPAGYVTTWTVPGAANFTFLTVKEAGHMVRVLPSHFVADFPFLLPAECQNRPFFVSKVGRLWPAFVTQS